MDEARALLDDLMGRDRNAPAEIKQQRTLHFSDRDVCKFFLAGGFCPHELFTNTKSYLGPCGKNHDELSRSEFSKLPEERRRRYGYEQSFCTYLEELILEVDVKVKKAHIRLEEKDDPSEEHVEQLKVLSDQIEGLLKQVEDLGEEGKVEEARVILGKADVLKSQKERLMEDIRKETLPFADRRGMEVCDICGAMLVIGDTEKRQASHLEGKQHVGYALIRNWIQEYRAKYPAGHESHIAETSRSRDHSSRERHGSTSGERSSYERRHDSYRRRHNSPDRDFRRDRNRHDYGRDRTKRSRYS